MKCSSCGRELYGSSCPFCGSGGFGFGFNSTEGQGSNNSLGFESMPSGQNNFDNGNFGSNGFGSGSFGQNFYQPIPPKKKKSSWLIILLCAVCAVALVTTVVLLASGGGDADETTPYTAVYTAEPQDTTFYTYTATETQLPVYTYPVYTAKTTEPAVTEKVTTAVTTTVTAAVTATTEPPVIKPEPSDIIPFFELKYFLNALDEKELENICALYEGISNFEKSIELPNYVPSDTLLTHLTVLHYECPELFQYDYSQTYTYYYDGKSENVKSVELPYAFTQSEYEALRKQCEDIISSFADATVGMSDVEKEKYVYDWFGSHCVYDAQKTHSGSPHSAFLNGYAKCDGFSLATKWVLESFGIQCLCVSYSAIDGGIGHAWNIINLENNYYLLDTTFGVPTQDSVSMGIDFQTYCGFNTADTWTKDYYSIEKYFTEVAPIPVCNITTESYYALRGGLVRSGQNPVDVILSRLDDLKNGKIERIELQFENTADYNAFKQSSNDRISEALDLYGAPWSGTHTYSHDYYAFTIHVDFN